MADKPLDDLFKHTLELNRQYMSQGFKVLTELTQRREPGSKLFTFRPELYSRAFNSFARLNLEYYNNMMEIGLSMADEFIKSKAPVAATPAEPAFELEGTGLPGGTTDLHFVLENTKSALAECNILNSPFTDESGSEAAPAIRAEFSPQHFMQEAGETTTIVIRLHIPKTSAQGKYFSDVHVAGFEPSFFRVILNIEKPARKASNVQAKKWSEKKA